MGSIVGGLKLTVSSEKFLYNMIYFFHVKLHDLEFSYSLAFFIFVVSWRFLARVLIFR